MTDYKKLVDALRCKDLSKQCDSCKYGYHLCPDSECNDACNVEQVYADAAAAIEALEAEVKRLKMRCADCEYGNSPWPEEPVHEPKRGEWQKAKPKGVVTYSDGYAECSHCHEAIWLGWGMNFCPNCGTQNRIIDPDDYDGAKMEVQDGQ